MNLRKRESSTPADLLPVVDRLRANQPKATEHELDRAKLRAMTQASGARRAPRAGNGAVMKSRRVISIALAIGLMSGGTAVIAKSGGPSTAASTSSSASSQYCPPSSPEAGKPKKPGPSKCGKP